jgi:hypothetical protein
MKRTAQVIAALSMATALSAMAQSSANETYALSDVFPNMVTHEQLHRSDPVGQARTSAYPSAGAQTIPLSQIFPNMVTYQDLHKDDVARSTSVAASEQR